MYAGDWTVLVYMAADNNLASYAEENIIEMERALQPEGLNLIVQVDLPVQGARRYKIEHRPAAGINSPVIQSLGTIDSGHPDTLQDFIRWGFNRYPSSRKMLIIWSHADSWYKNPKYIAPDEDSGNMIGVANGELLGALTGTPHLDILLFDACSMQSIEILYELRHCSDIIIGSADQVPVRGFPYETMIPNLEGEPSLIAEQIPALYTDSYLPGSANNPSMGYLITTCSAVQTQELSSFFDAWRDFSTTLWSKADQLPAIREELFEMNSGYADVDIYQFLHRLDKAQLIDTKALLSNLDDMILASSYTLPWVETELSSVALWFPDIPLNLQWAWQIYMKLAFAKSGWLSVVNQALGDDQTPPLPVELLRQDQRFGKLYLRVKTPIDIDSLYYLLETDHGNEEIYPPAYAAEFETNIPIDSDGQYRIYAIDRSGNISSPLAGDYDYQPPQKAMLIRPNPIRDSRLAYLEWYLEDTENKTIKIKLFNIRGQMVAAEEISGGPDGIGMFKLDEMKGFSTLSDGVYILELSSGGNRIRKKLTIMH